VQEPQENRTRSVLRLLGYARPYAWLVAIVIGFSLLYGGARLAAIGIMGVRRRRRARTRVDSIEDLLGGAQTS
jgi:hypothetical protein